MFARCLHFWAKMLVPWDVQTDSHWSTVVAPFRRGGRDAEGGGKGGRVTSFLLVSPTRDRTSWTHQPFTHPPSLPSPTVFPWWERWQRLMDNWKLQSTESNYPERDFPNILCLQCGVVVLFVSSVYPCF